MDKLTLENIAPYLPYGMKCEILNYKNDYVCEKYGIITGYYWYAGEPHFMFKDRSVAGKDVSLFKPILRPLSDLTKEIEHGGEKFVPIEKLGLDNDEGSWIVLQYGIATKEMQYKLMQNLFKWHFDVLELIEKGLAIDINTI